MACANWYAKAAAPGRPLGELLAGYRGQYHKPRGTAPSGPINVEEERRKMRLPRESERETLGIVTGLMGGSRMRVQCKDGKERMCRIPGKLRNRIWVKDGDVVIVKIFEIQADTKGEIIWRYFPLQARILKEEGLI